MITDPKILIKLKGRGLVLYDGDCGFCQFWVQFILKRDRKGSFVCAPLQAEWTKALHAHAYEGSGFNTIFLYEDGVLYQKSSAALRIFSRLTFPWQLARIFFVIPQTIRDYIYDAIAKRRYRLSSIR